MDQNEQVRLSINELYASFGIMPISGGSGEEDDADDDDEDDEDEDDEESDERDDQKDGKQKDGDDKQSERKPITFPSQEAFNRRIDRARRSWERDERPKIVDEVREQLKAELSGNGNDQSVEAKATLDRVLSGDETAIPRGTKLHELLAGLKSKLDKIEEAAEDDLEAELEELNDKQRKLIPQHLSVTEQLSWVRDYKSTLPRRRRREERDEGHESNKPKQKRDNKAFDQQATIRQIKNVIGYDIS